MRALVWLSLWLAGCALQAGSPGRISVEVYRGMGGNAAGSFHPTIALLVDARETMGAAAAPQATHLAAAKAKAEELLAALPAGTRVSLYTLGEAASGEDCAPLERRAHATASDGGALLDPLAALEPAGQGSLAAALQTLTRQVSDEGRARDSRVVVLTDLHDEPRCGGDLCQAAARLVESGAWLDIAVIGDAPEPRCLAALRPSAEAPGALLRALTRPPARWSLGAQGEAEPVLRGSAGPLELEAPAGEWQLEVELERPLRIAPLSVAPARTTRVRVLDFPGGPPRYEWRVLDERR
jgi:hypothetical protein